MMQRLWHAMLVRLMSLGAILVCVVGVLAGAVRAAGPNVVLIISDDQAYRDFGFMGNDVVQTPHLDRLAAKSARFVNGYVPSSVCSPSLATLLTGLYPHQHGIHYNHPPPGNGAMNRMTSAEQYRRIRSRSFERIRRVPTVPRLLSERRGYVSLQTGKFWEGHYANAGFTHGMTVFEPVPGQDYGGNRTLASGEIVAHGNGDWGLKIGRETMQPIEEFLQDHARQPFYLWYAPFLPHQPHDAPQRFVDRYKGRPDIPAHRVPYYASISQFDETVGQLVRLVESHASARDTLFIFVVDNGWTASERPSGTGDYQQTKRSKRSPFEDGLRTPILLRWEGRVTPATHGELVSSIDVAPTILVAAGRTEEAAALPGINLLPVAMGTQQLDPDRAIFGEIYPGDASSLGNPSRDIAYRWVRQGDWKLITVHRQGTAEAWGDYLTTDALYNVVMDPGESNNLIDEPNYAETVRRLRSLLDAWWLP
jgi:uncharacterized sulfatase